MAGDRPQPGNPERLTIRQHVVSVAHLQRWSVDGVVEASRRPFTRSWCDRPENMLWARRRWSQKTELVRFKRAVEDPFHQELDHLDTQESVQDHEAVTRYFVLWWFRSRYIDTKEPNTRLRAPGLEDLVGPTRAEQDCIEANGAVFIRDGGLVPGRFSVGIDWMGFLDVNQRQIAATRWLCFRLDGDLVLGDTPYAEVIPIGPNRVLVGAGLAARARFNAEALNELALRHTRIWRIQRPGPNCR